MKNMKKIDFGPAPNLPSNIVFGPAPNFNWNSYAGVDEPIIRLRTSLKKRDIRAIDEPFQPSILQNESVMVECNLE